MRHVFILNPAAGKHGRAMELQPKIEAYFAAHGGEYTVCITNMAGDATRFACEEAEKGDHVRLYAAGGDGTLNEVANGVGDRQNAEIACIPCGSGNDYIRTFGSADDFTDLAAMIEGEAVPVDGILCNGALSINLCSLGLDADVGMNMNKFKHWPGVSGSMAYDLALVKVLLSPTGHSLKLTAQTVDGEITREGRFLFVLAGSGEWYGGGYHGAPDARPDDGLLDFVLVRAVPKYKLLGLIGGYKRGEHYAWTHICEHIRGTHMEVSADHPLCINVDGECHSDTRVSFSVRPHLFRFVMPKGTTLGEQPTVNHTPASAALV